MLYLNYPSWISPVVIPGLPFRWYGVMYLLAFGVSYALFRYQVRKRQLAIDTDEILNFFFWCIIGLLIGARIFSALIYDPSGVYLRKPWLIFWPFDEHMRFTGFQGMSYHGGLVGVIAAAVIYSRVRKLDLLLWADLLVAGVPLGYTFGRVGNFINGELWGRVTTAPWGVIFPDAPRFPANLKWVALAAQKAGISVEFSNQLVNLPRHPSQIYEALLEGLVLWVIIWFFVRPRQKYPGQVTAIYVIGYAAARFFVEYFREPDAGLGFIISLSPISNPPELLLTPFNFTMGQILSFLMMAGGVVTLLLLRRAYMKRPQIPTFDTSAPPDSGRKIRFFGTKGGRSSGGPRNRRHTE